MEPRSERVGVGAPGARRSGLSPPRRPKESRGEPRWRVHLRAGQISDRQHHFICDCVVRDRSKGGARLLLPRNIKVPLLIWFYDEEYGEAVKAEVRWRRNQEIGILKLPHGPSGHPIG